MSSTECQARIIGHDHSRDDVSAGGRSSPADGAQESWWEVVEVSVTAMPMYTPYTLSDRIIWTRLYRIRGDFENQATSSASTGKSYGNLDKHRQGLPTGAASILIA